MSNEYHLVIPAVTIATGTNDVFAITEGAGSLACTIEAGTYYLRGDASADDLLEAVLDAINAAGADTYTGTISALGTTGLVVDIANETDQNTIEWGTFDGSDLGFSSNLTLEADFSSDQSPRGAWVSNDLAESVDQLPRALGSQITTVGGQTYTHDRSGTTWTDLRIVWPWILEAYVEPLELVATAQPRTLYACWARWRDGRSLEIHKTTLVAASLTTSTLVGRFVLDGSHVQSIRASRQGPGIPYYTSEPLTFRAWVAQ